MSVSTESLKKTLSPDRYYTSHLSGSFGRATGRGWHRWNGLCPFHKDSRAGSLVINKITGAFRCFSCGTRGGDIIAFHMQDNKIDFREALSRLQELT